MTTSFNDSKYRREIDKNDAGQEKKKKRRR